MKFSLLCAIALKLLLSGSLAFSSPTFGDWEIELCNRNCDFVPNMYCEKSSLACKCLHGMLLNWNPWTTNRNHRCLQKVGGVCRVSDSKTGKNTTLPCVENAECDENDSNLCKCSPGYYVENGACFPVQNIGVSCNGSDQCGTEKFTGSQLVCLTKKCSCDPSNSVYAYVKRNARYVGEDAKVLCAPLATKLCFQGFCAPRAKCSSYYSSYYRRYWAETHYTDSAVCDCESPYTSNERTLECAAPYGEVCNLKIPCNDGLVCHGSTSRCRCASYQFYDSKQKKCVNELGSFCEAANECIQNANCNNSRCHCKSGYIHLGKGKSATCAASHGTSCLQNSDCDQTNNLRCAGRGTKKTCTCKLGLKMFQKSRKCALSNGAVCNLATPCGDDMKCTNGICKCFDHMHFDRETESCAKNVGEACVYQTHCGSKAFCSHGVCRCDKGYAAIAAGGCAADFGTVCRLNVNCTQAPNELICTNGTCACKSGLVRSSTTRLCSLEYGTRCNSTIPCADKLVCNGTCRCAQGQYFRSNRCISYASEKCSSHEDCTLNSNCQNRICVCKPGYIQTSEGHCRPDHGSRCFKNSDCDQSKNELRCSESKTCDCRPGLKMSNGRCSLQFEARCNNTIPCFGNLVCNGTCACSEGRDFRNERCANLAGERCRVIDDCLFNSECRNQACVCKKGYIQTATKLCAPDFGSPCSQSSNCDQSKNNLTCDGNGICGCPFNLKMSNETGQCSLPFEAPCNGSIPCGNSLVCKESKCQCPIRSQDFDKISNRCLLAVVSIDNSIFSTFKIRITMTSNASDSPENFLQIKPSATTYSTTELAEISSTASNLESSESSSASTTTCIFCENETSDHTSCQVQPTAESSVTTFNLTCSVDPDCLSIQKNMICNNKTCVCETGLDISPTTGTCSLAHGAPCTKSKFCDEGLVCNCLCSCPAGQYFSLNRCISYSGSTCSDYTDCVSNSDCFNKTCVCKDGYVQSPSGECQADFGTSCSSDVDCDRTKTNLRCSDEQTCDCQQGSTMSPTDGICYVESEVLQNSTCEVHAIGRACFGREFGEPCNETTSPCLTRNLLECQNGTCVCNSDSEYNIEQETCIHLEGHGLLGNPCTNEQFCTPGQCIEGICGCPSDFYSEGPFSCFPKKNFHEPCNADFECGKDNFTTSDLKCLNGTCSCNPETSVWAAVVQNDCGSENSQPTSLCAPLPNEPCFRGYCSPGAICRMHFFEYGKNGFYTSRQKSNFTMPICDCIPPLQASPKSGICSSPPGHVCNSAFPCIDTFECINGTCACSQTQHFDPLSNTCKTLVPHQCQLSSECTFFSECVDGVCICQSGYVPRESGFCAAEVGGNCSVDADCDQITNKLECIQSFCRCQADLKLNLATGICSLPYNAECTEETPCGETFICIDGRCSCDSNTGFYNATIDRCLSNVGGSCHETSECVKWSFCYREKTDDQNGLCHCKPGTYETKQRFCARGHQAPCRTSDECLADNGLICKDFQCKCPMRHLYSAEYRACQGLVREPCTPPNGGNGIGFPPCVANADCVQQARNSIFKCVCTKGWVRTRNFTCERG